MKARTMSTYYAHIECSPSNLEVVLYSLRNQPYVWISPKNEPLSHFLGFGNQLNRDLLRSFARRNGFHFKELKDIDLQTKEFQGDFYKVVGDQTLIAGAVHG